MWHHIGYELIIKGIFVPYGWGGQQMGLTGGSSEMIDNLFGWALSILMVWDDGDVSVKNVFILWRLVFTLGKQVGL